MENKLPKLFEELSVDESLEIDAGAFAPASAPVNPGFVLVYGIGIGNGFGIGNGIGIGLGNGIGFGMGIGLINSIIRLLK